MGQVSSENPMKANGDINKRFCSSDLTQAKSNIKPCDDSSDGRCNVPQNKCGNQSVSKTENCDLQLPDDTSQNKPMVSNRKYSL